MLTDSVSKEKDKGGEGGGEEKVNGINGGGEE